MAETGRKAPGAGTGRARHGRLAPAVFLVAAAAALLVALAAGLLVAFAAAPRESRRSAEAVDRAHAALVTARRERFLRLEATARALAAEPALAAALRSAAGAAESPAADALADLLTQRRGDLGFDLALVLGPEGRALAADGASVAGDDPRTDDPLVRMAREEGSARGAWLLDGTLTDAAAVRVAPDFEPLGVVVAAARSEELFALELSRASGAGVTLVARGPGGPVPAGSSLGADAAADLAGELSRRTASGPGGGEPGPPTEVVAGGRELTALTAPLLDAAGEPAGAAVLTAPTAAPAGGLYAGLAAATAAALLLAAVLAVLLARRSRAPVDRLAGIVEAAPREGFARRVDPERAGALAPVAAALDRLFGRLQEERSLTTAAAASEAGAIAEARTLGAVAATDRRVAVAAVDLRGFAEVAAGEEPARQAGVRLARDRALVRAEVEARGGEMAGAAGHRLLATFAGDDAALSALGAAAAAVSGIGDRENRGGASAAAPAAAVAAGRVATAPSAAAGGRFLVGPAVQLVESLLREAAAGDVVLGPSVVRDVEGRLAEAGIEPSEQRGILSPRPLRFLAGDAVRSAAEALAAPRAVSGPDLPAAVPGSLLDGRYEVVDAVAVHPGSDLLRAYDRELGRLVAVRRVASAAAARGAAAAVGLDGALQRMRRVSHPGLTEVLDAGETRGGWYLAREWVDGRPLSRVGDLPLPAALGLARGLAAALAAVHAEGLAHGRVVPESVVLDPAGRVRLTDLGLTRLLASPPAPAGGPHALPPELRHREEGTPPEPPAADPGSDVWGVGAILHRQVLGDWPSGGMREAEAQLAERDLPPGLARAIARCLASEPGRRWADAGELAAALEDVRA